MTLHEITFHIHGGDIIHQTVAEPVKNDGIHDFTRRVVISLKKEINWDFWHKKELPKKHEKNLNLQRLDT